jgi:hypothetical protein
MSIVEADCELSNLAEPPEAGTTNKQMEGQPVKIGE